MTTDAPKGHRTCPRCGASFTCGIAAGEAHCWCFDLPNVIWIDDEKVNEGCLCPACLRDAIKTALHERNE
jgi:hypothetical protein